MIKLSGLLERLSNQLSIKQKLCSFLVLAQIYEPIRHYYWSKHIEDKSDDYLEIRVKNSRGFGADRFQEAEDRNGKMGVEDGNGKRRFEMPKLGLIPVIYQSITNTYHILGLFRANFLILIQTGCFGLQKHLNCYIPGRLSIHPDIAYLMPYFELFSNLFHINWRLRTMVIEDYYRIDCVPFLMSDKIELINQLDEESFLIDHDSSASKSPTSPTNKLPTSIKRPQNNYLRQVFYAEMTFNEFGRPEYYLKPNRTKESRMKLFNLLNHLMGWSVLLSFLVISSFLPIILNAGLFDINYIINYPTCSPEIEKLAKENKLNRWSADIFSFNHRTWTIGFDVIVNAIVWSEDLFAILFPTGMCILMVEDLMIYWRFLRKSLDKLLFILEVERDSKHRRPGRGKRELYGSWEAERDSMRDILDNEDCDWKIRWQPDDNHPAGKQIQILQQLMLNFFEQLKCYDRFVSFLITTYLELWAVLLVSTGYLGFYEKSVRILYIVRFVQIMGIVSLGGLTIYLLRLSKCTREAYPVICAIMAYETNLDRKRYWSSILETYTCNLTCGFTVFFKHQITWMTLLNYIGTAISLLVALETFRKSAESF